MRNPQTKLEPLLEQEAAALREKGAYVWVELLDLPRVCPVNG
ncbi:hypothetical protein ACFPIJ_26035 [Dactylosporangium cerinum]|uniref:Uncharacterized protein n=1 Tax=Dactylosporangium cerinum TaxID=1434730 RepID=A0ABV9W0V9_9ACTN